MVSHCASYQRELKRLDKAEPADSSPAYRQLFRRLRRIERQTLCRIGDCHDCDTARIESERAGRRRRMARYRTKKTATPDTPRINYI